MSNQVPVTPRYPARLLSPFRYPGGKTWLVPYVCQWLHEMEPRPAMFVEPFAGGGVVGLNVAYRRLAEHITLIELDEDVAAVWRTIFNGSARSLAERIVAFDVDREAVEAALSKAPDSLEERAFQTILKNRVNRAGILASGAGMLRNGEDGRGIDSRWYPETLEKRILEIDGMRDRITFVGGDGLKVLRLYTWPIPISCLTWLLFKLLRLGSSALGPCPRSNVVFFIDPPYTVGGKQAGKRLYRHHELEHENLFRMVCKLKGDFLMTYSRDNAVRELAEQHNLDIEEVPMRSSHHVKMAELLIGRDLGWVRRLCGSAVLPRSN